MEGFFPQDEGDETFELWRALFHMEVLLDYACQLFFFHDAERSVACG